MKAVMYFLTIVTVLFLAMSAQADPRLWGDEGISVRQGTFVYDKWTTAEDGNGNTLVVWADVRSGSYDIYAQMVDAEGVAQWNAEGVTVCDHSATQVSPVACASADGWVIAWADTRFASADHIYAQRLDMTGARQWSANEYSGIYVGQTGREMDSDAPGIASDRAGGALVCWKNWSSAQVVLNVQHVGGNGTLLWLQPLAAICFSDDYCKMSTADDGVGNLLVSWEDQPDHMNALRATKITTEGGLPWGADGRFVSDSLVHNRYSRICADGHGGCFVAWQNPIPGDLYGRAIHVQHLDASAQLLWPEDGVRLQAAFNNHENPFLALSWNGTVVDGCIAVWECSTLGGANQEAYAQKVNLFGSRVWGENGRRLSIEADSVQCDYPQVRSDRAGGAVCAWSHSGDYYAARILADGSFGWNSDRVRISGPIDGHHFLSPVLYGNDLLFPVIDLSSGSKDLRVMSADLATGAPGSNPEGTLLLDGLDGAINESQSIPLADGRMGVVWEDQRYGDRRLYYQILSSTGMPERALNGQPLIPDIEGATECQQEEPSLCDDGQGGFLVAYQDARIGGFRIRLAHVNAAGEIISPAAGCLLWEDAVTLDQLWPRIVSDGSGGYYVAFSNASQDFEMDVYIQRVNAELQPLWTAPVQLSFAIGMDDKLRGLVTTPDHGAIALWRTGRQPQYDIVSAQVIPYGAVAWTTSVCNADRIQENPVMVADGAGGAFYAWDDRRVATTSYDVYAQHLDHNGLPLWSENGVAVCIDTLQQLRPQIALDNDGNLLVAWEDFRSGIDLDLYMQKLDPAGARFWDTTGVAIQTDRGSSNDLQLLSDGNNGWFMAWTQGHSYPQPETVYGLHLNNDGGIVGNPYWVAGGSLLTSSSRAQWSVTLTAGAPGTAFITWLQDNAKIAESGLRDLHAQSISLATSAADDVPSAMPLRYTLSQNFPNPFNPQTEIAFELPLNSDVTLTVYDLLGREVTTLVDRNLTAGSHTLLFDGSDLSSGVYFYRLEAAPFSATRKMVLLK